MDIFSILRTLIGNVCIDELVPICIVVYMYCERISIKFSIVFCVCLFSAFSSLESFFKAKAKRKKLADQGRRPLKKSTLCRKEQGHANMCNGSPINPLKSLVEAIIVVGASNHDISSTKL